MNLAIMSSLKGHQIKLLEQFSQLRLFDDSTDFKVESDNTDDEKMRKEKLSGFTDIVESTLASDSKFDKRVIKLHQLEHKKSRTKDRI